MKLFVAVITVLLSSIACHNVYAGSIPSGTDCSRHPLQCAIMSLQPAIKAGEAHTLSNYIYKYSKKYEVDPYRVIAIGMQESSLQNINRVNNQIITDVGMFQFNVNTIDAYEMDFERLQTDLSYQVEMACWLLSQKLKYCSDLGMDAWTCYHSRTEKYRLLYQDLVNRYYKGEQDVSIRKVTNN